MGDRMITIHDVEQGTEEWQQLRAGRFTGSSAHKLLKYGARAYSMTEASDFAGTFHTKRGHLLEDEAIEVYEAVNKREVQRPGFITNDKYPSAGYSPDGIDANGGATILNPRAVLLENKSFSEEKHLALVTGKMPVPLEILAQIQFGLLISGLRLARLIMYHPKVDPTLAYKVFEFKRRLAVQQRFKELLKVQVAA